MDHECIDRLSRVLAVPGVLSRRGALVVLGTTMLGMLTGVDSEPTEAKRKPRHHSKHETRHRGGSKSRHQTRPDSRDVEARLHAAKRKKQQKSKKQRHGGDEGLAGATSPGESSTQPTGTPPPTCAPQCAATNPCGDDSCSGSCGTCPENEMCQGGTCRCRPQCDGKTCGPDGCGGSCGTCGAQEVCDGGTCLCTPECGTKVCGGDGCGGSCGSCTDQGAATCGTTGACSGGRCERYASGTECQAATCTSESTLRPASTCDGQGRCNRPAELTCPSDFICRNGTCLTRCQRNEDCAANFICGTGGTCVPEFKCDCSNLNNCSGNGVCTANCYCLCDPEWSGASCSDPSGPPPACGDYSSCTECLTHIGEGCTWCQKGSDPGDCRQFHFCADPVETCPAGG
jgi:hypothetical protein